MNEFSLFLLHTHSLTYTHRVIRQAHLYLHTFIQQTITIIYIYYYCTGDGMETSNILLELVENVRRTRNNKIFEKIKRIAF